MARKIIQITTATAPDQYNTPWCSVYALCDDGTLWLRVKDGWMQLKPMPDVKVEAAFPPADPIKGG